MVAAHVTRDAAGRFDGLVSVVVPNWNGKALLDIPLRGLVAQTCRPLEIIVVDNGSTDGSVDYLSANWPAVTVVRLPVNLGFGGGVNAGIAVATGAYVALLNTDIEVPPGWLECLVQIVEADDQVAAVAGKFLDFDDRTLIQECGTEFAWDGTVRQIGRGERDVGQYVCAQDVFAVCAGAALYRRTVIDLVGTFDEAFFAYLEDVDWCFRAWRAGFRSVFTPDAHVFHMRSTTTRAHMLPLRRLNTRNGALLVLKCYPREAFARHWPLVVRRQVRLFARAARRGWARTYVQAMFDVFGLLRHIVRCRRRIAAIGNRGGAQLPTVERHHPAPAVTQGGYWDS